MKLEVWFNDKVFDSWAVESESCDILTAIWYPLNIVIIDTENLMYSSKHDTPPKWEIVKMCDKGLV